MEFPLRGTPLKTWDGYFFSSVGFVVLEAPSLIDDLKFLMPSPRPLPSSPSFLGPKMSRAMNTMTASSGRPIFPPNIRPPVKQPGCSACRQNRLRASALDSRLLPGARQRTIASRNLANLQLDRKSTRLNSSHLGISYAVF